MSHNMDNVNFSMIIKAELLPKVSESLGESGNILLLPDNAYLTSNYNVIIEKTMFTHPEQPMGNMVQRTGDMIAGAISICFAMEDMGLDITDYRVFMTLNNAAVLDKGHLQDSDYKIMSIAEVSKNVKRINLPFGTKPTEDDVEYSAFITRDSDNDSIQVGIFDKDHIKVRITNKDDDDVETTSEYYLTPYQSVDLRKILKTAEKIIKANQNNNYE